MADAAIRLGRMKRAVGFEAEYTFEPLSPKAEIQHRLKFLRDCTLPTTRELALPGKYLEYLTEFTS